VALSTQVIIIGAGPTGLSMAAQLVRFGIDFIILDKKDGTTDLSKAIVVQARTMEIFDELGLAQKAIQRGQVTTAMNMFYKGKKRAFVNLAGLGEGISPFSFALSLEQSKTEQLLAEHLLEHQKMILWNCSFKTLQQHDEAVTVTYTDAEGNEQLIEAKYAVGCDGASSPVRHSLGLDFKGDTAPKIFYVADVTLRSNVINKNQLYIFLIRKGFILFFPMEGDRHYRVVGILPDAKADEEFEFSDIDQYIIDQVKVDLSFDELRWFSSYKVHSRKADYFMKGRCFIAGDAGHIHTPAGGQGMNTGIQDGYNLAWKIAYHLKGWVNDNVLYTYHTERTANAAHLLKTTDRMFDIMAGTHRIGNFIRLWIFPLFAGSITRSRFVRRLIFPLISQTGIAYPHSYLTVKSAVGKVKAGDRMHYFILPDGSHIFEHLKAPSYKVLFFGESSFPHDDLSRRIGVPFQFQNFTYIPSQLFGNARNFYLLLRPDNHIAELWNAS